MSTVYQVRSNNFQRNSTYLSVLNEVTKPLAQSINLLPHRKLELHRRPSLTLIRVVQVQIRMIHRRRDFDIADGPPAQLRQELIRSADLFIGLFALCDTISTLNSPGRVSNVAEIELVDKTRLPSFFEVVNPSCRSVVYAQCEGSEGVKVEEGAPGFWDQRQGTTQSPARCWSRSEPSSDSISGKLRLASAKSIPARLSAYSTYHRGGLCVL